MKKTNETEEMSEQNTYVYTIKYYLHVTSSILVSCLLRYIFKQSLLKLRTLKYYYNTNYELMCIFDQSPFI